ncbi:MAG: ribonuclease HI [Desulfobacteraceae bacterium]|nr:ribonuclease HI [Pseudomonadota bacterium]MCG2751560.1 ribonuclease HI [Desulfobacteraceae bacterium]
MTEEIADNQNWVRRMFRNNKVWMAVSPDGKALLKDGKVLLKYQLNQDYEYWVHEKSVQGIEDKGASPDQKKSSLKKPGGKIKASREKEPSTPNEEHPENTIYIFTDGASSGNPGPAGIGVVLKCGDLHKEISRYIGRATNNIAELEAIKTGLLAIKNPGFPVRVFTDSSYALGVIAKGWKPQKNQDLIQSILDLKNQFSDLAFIKVKGHSGHPENEAADRLATSAIKAVKGSERQ